MPDDPQTIHPELTRPYRSIQTKPEPSCPECGARMVLRRPKPGQSWSPFWGCNRYPNCWGKRMIDPETGRPESDVI